MEQREQVNISITGKSIAKNTLYNLLGNIFPLLFAVIFIPSIIKGLGNERFGILSIAWMIIGYFGFLDFGIGKGLTKIISEKIGISQTNQISKIFWTTLFLMMIVSFLASITLFFFAPLLVGAFNISPSLHQETTRIIYLLGLSIPIITTMATLRGSLEAYQKFAAISLIRIILGVTTFLGPFLVLLITNSLFWIIVFLILGRLFIWGLFFIKLLSVNKNLMREIKIDFNVIKPVLTFSIWITFANIVVPLMFYSDRFLIGILVSVSALTFYVTPYEIITKLTLIPDALSGVLFPVFAASFLYKPEVAKIMFLRGTKYVFLILFPIVFFVVTFSFEGISLWLGEEFAKNSHFILQLLSIGVMMNCISLIPTNFFQGTGKPKIPTIIVLMELPFYLFFMWFATRNMGITGAAMVFMIGATINVVILFLTAKIFYKIQILSDNARLFTLPLLLALVIPFLIESIYTKILFAAIFVLIFPVLCWKYFLSDEEKSFILSKIKLNILSK